MSGRGSGRRGRGGRGGAKRSRDDFEKKPQSASKPAEPAAPLPGGFKSLKAKWISVYENEKKAQESAPAVRPQSAADTAGTKSTAAEPLGAKPQLSAPHSVTKEWRKQNSSEAVKAPDKEEIGSSSKHHSRHTESVLEGEGKADSKQQPDTAAASPVAVPHPKVPELTIAALQSNAPSALPEAPSSTAGGAVQADVKAETSSGAHNQEVPEVQQSVAAQAPAGSSGPGLAPEQPAAKPASSGGLGPGRVAAMQDAAATYKAASKAHSSMQEALSPKRADASGKLPAPKAAAAVLSRATGAEARPAVPGPSMPSEDAVAQAQQGQHVAVAKPEQAVEAPHSMADQSRDPVLMGAALQDASAGPPEEEKGGLANLDRIQQPESEIKQETIDPVDSSAAPMRAATAPEQKKASTKERAAGKSGSESGPRQPKQKAQKGPPERQQAPEMGAKQSAGSALEQPAQNGPGPDGKRAGQPGQSGQKTGQRASQKAQLEPASKRELKKALAQAKEAADSRVAEAQDKAEDRIDGWRAQLQEPQDASNGAPPPIQSAPGDAHGCAEEASRQKGSDASSLERSPDIPHPQQQQQQLADQAEMQGGEDQEEQALADAKPVTADSQPSQLAPVEYLGEGSSASQQLGQIDLQQFDSYRALWDGLREDYGQSLPEGLQLRLVYEDGEGDFVMLQPDEPWPTFLSSARRVIISCQ